MKSIPYPEIGRMAAGMSPSGRRQARGSRVCHIVESDLDVIDVIMSFVCIHTHLPVAGVSIRWRDVWGQRPRVTSVKWTVQSCSCLDWAKACGLDISSRPCLLAAAEGRLDVLQHAVALGYSREGMPICERAAAGGHLEVVKWCRANGYPWGLSKLLAAEGGHLEVLQWCIASNAPVVVIASRVNGRCGYRGFWVDSMEPKSDLLNAAVEGGHLETVKWCLQQGYLWNGDTRYLAARGGHLELLKWLRDKGCPWFYDTMIGAVNAEDLEMLEWCRANGCSWGAGVIPETAEHGTLEIVKWCVANSPHNGIHNLTCSDAAAGGHLEVVQWLRGMGCRWGRSLCFYTVYGGHFESLKWCIKNGCPWNDLPREEIAIEFNVTVPMLVWATANGCPWMAHWSAVNRLCWDAAAGGNLEVLNWCATNHRIEGSAEAITKVAGNGHVHVLEWLRANTGVLDGNVDMDSKLCYYAAQSGSLETVKWCRVNGYPWCQATCAAAARSGNLELLQWCRANGCPWDAHTCWMVIQRGDFEMLAWCRDNGCPPDRTWADSSLWGGYTEMIDWCWEKSPTW